MSGLGFEYKAGPVGFKTGDNTQKVIAKEMTERKRIAAASRLNQARIAGKTSREVTGSWTTAVVPIIGIAAIAFAAWAIFGRKGGSK